MLTYTKVALDIEIDISQDGRCGGEVMLRGNRSSNKAGPLRARDNTNSNYRQTHSERCPRRQEG